MTPMFRKTNCTILSSALFFACRRISSFSFISSLLSPLFSSLLFHFLLYSSLLDSSHLFTSEYSSLVLPIPPSMSKGAPLSIIIEPSSYLTVSHRPLRLYNSCANSCFSLVSMAQMNSCSLDILRNWRTYGKRPGKYRNKY